MLLRREVLEEDGSVEDQVSSTTKAKKCDENSERDPAGCSAGSDTEDRADEERNIKGEAAADDVSREAPEEGTSEHADIDGDSKGVGESGAELVLCLSSDDRLKQ